MLAAGSLAEMAARGDCAGGGGVAGTGVVEGGCVSGGEGRGVADAIGGNNTIGGIRALLL
jgi:hypothetical protein